MSRNICIVAGAVLLLSVAANAGHLKLVRNQSSVEYVLVHALHTVKAVSNDVEYEVVTDSTNHITLVACQVDVTSFSSGNSNRDSHAMEVVDSITYPAATYSSSSVNQTGDSLHVTGKMTFHGVTQDVAMNGTAKWNGDTLKVAGRFPISLTAFKVERPSFLMMPVQDTVWFNVQTAFSKN